MPSDSDVMEDFILKSNCGWVCHDVDSCCMVINKLLRNKTLKKSLIPKHNHYYARNFSRETQTKKLAKLIIKTKQSIHCNYITLYTLIYL